MKYPFEPRSTRSLKQGQYWCFQLCDGRYVAVVVLGRVIADGKLHSRLLTAALVDWVGPQQAKPEELEKGDLLHRGFTHVRAIQTYGREIVGEVPRLFTDFPAEMPFSYAATPGWPVLGLASLRYKAELLWGDKDWVHRELEEQQAAIRGKPPLKGVA